ncbi:MAG: transcription termination factor NusA [Candidatus Harrisonbacteria bacterium RIFOXYD1_FULL_40_9]|uniref:Transcription termination/antitermination protein NusA n=1 Tax=Candidatus Harrisonbacteria bacterium RIFOXYD1_FULL_40_9 TaxID=1798412 RepID=A0A1G1ZZP6_9BACT|nr:MAG: transcription termination factor NusA [Candidatus Harrisonbacteria bacterium RIFOXYD1_FULL_40_9]
MMDLKSLAKVVDQIAKEKGLPEDKVWEAIESSIAAAYRREYSNKGEVIKAKINPKEGTIKFWQVKVVVNKDMLREGENEGVLPEEEQRDGEALEDKKIRFQPERHILIEDAQAIKANIQVGEELEFSLEPREDFGRIAAQSAKQVVLQKLREAERHLILQEFQDKIGKIVSGVVQRFERGNVYIDLGRSIGVMFANESIPGEHYRTNERLRFYVLAVQEEARMPGIILSRAHPQFVAKLFEMEVPEIGEGIVEIKAIAREAGSRTKIAVASKVDGMDPIGSCVGQRGTRVMSVMNELGQEKIDIISWSDVPEKFVMNSLSPAKVTRVEILPRHEARALLPEDQLSLAIGKGGQNVRLAHRLTGWKIDVRSEVNPNIVQEGGVSSREEGGDAASESEEGVGSQE